MEKQEFGFYEKLRTGSSYSRNLNHNYLVLDMTSLEESVDFAVRMVAENRIRALLPLELRQENGETYCYYEVSSLQPMIRIYETKKMRGDDLAFILREILKAFSQVREYLLAEEELVLHQEFIFMNPETKEVRFLYCPFRQQEIGNIFGSLSEYFLDCIDHQDSEAVVLAYQFYKIVRNENFVLREVEDLCECQKRKLECRQEKLEAFVTESYENPSPCDVQSLPEEPKGKKNLPTVLKRKQFSVFLLLTVGSLIALAMNSNPVNSYSKMLSIGFLMFGIGGMAVSFLMKEKSMENAELSQEQVREGQILKGQQAKASTVGWSEELQEGCAGKDVQETEQVYGKTEFCLIEPEEEERVLVEKRLGKEIKHRITRLPFTIGKIKEMSDLYLQDASVSRLHARIFEEEGRLYVTDLGSTNGTYLNGIGINRDEKLQLEAGDELRVGKTEFVYQ